MTMPCAIWNTAATEDPREGNFTIFDSSRAGGRYKITESVSDMSARSASEKKVITTWLCDQRRVGVSTPTISSHNIDEIAARSLLGFSKRVDRALLFIASKIPRIDYRFADEKWKFALALSFQPEDSVAQVDNILLVLRHETPRGSSP
jgi:hypothetical protein